MSPPRARASVAHASNQKSDFRQLFERSALRAKWVLNSLRACSAPFKQPPEKWRNTTKVGARRLRARGFGKWEAEKLRCCFRLWLEPIGVFRAANTTLDTSLLRLVVLPYYRTACGFAPRLNRKP